MGHPPCATAGGCRLGLLGACLPGTKRAPALELAASVDEKAKEDVASGAAGLDAK